MDDVIAEDLDSRPDEPDWGAFATLLREGRHEQVLTAVPGHSVIGSVARTLSCLRGVASEPPCSTGDLGDLLRERLGTSPELMCLAETPEGRQKLIDLSRFTGVDKPGLEEEAAVALTARLGERCRLCVVEWPETGGQVVQLLLTLENPSGVAPLAQLRFLHGEDRNETEEIALTLRRDSLVVAGQVEVPLRWGEVPRLLTLVSTAEWTRVYIDGALMWARSQGDVSPRTGLNLDLIGVEGGEVTIRVHWLEIGSFEGEFRGFGEDDFAVGRTLIDKAIRERDERSLALLFHSFPRLAPAVEEEQMSACLVDFMNRERAFPDAVASGLYESMSAPARDRVDASITTMSPRPVLTVEGVGVHLSANAAGDRELSRLFGARERRTLMILEDVSFSIYPGDIVGVIGRNGAGKTTMLKALIGAVPISAGIIGATSQPVLLRPGAGMQPELTGRQNILQSGIYMGLSPRQIAGIMDEVIDFAELGAHIDRPYAYYSDGMRSRLIFSLATSISPEILMLDELLGAGDIGFQEKAMRRLEAFIGGAKAVIVVQHGLDFVMRRCSKCLYLRKGRQMYFGDPRIASEMYKSEF